MIIDWIKFVLLYVVENTGLLFLLTPFLLYPVVRLENVVTTYVLSNLDEIVNGQSIVHMKYISYRRCFSNVICITYCIFIGVNSSCFLRLDIVDVVVGCLLTYSLFPIIRRKDYSIGEVTFVAAIIFVLAQEMKYIFTPALYLSCLCAVCCISQDLVCSEEGVQYRPIKDNIDISIVFPTYLTILGIYIVRLLIRIVEAVLLIYDNVGVVI